MVGQLKKESSARCGYLPADAGRLIFTGIDFEPAYFACNFIVPYRFDIHQVTILQILRNRIAGVDKQLFALTEVPEGGDCGGDMIAARVVIIGERRPLKKILPDESPLNANGPQKIRHPDKRAGNRRHNLPVVSNMRPNIKMLDSNIRIGYPVKHYR